MNTEQPPDFTHTPEASLTTSLESPAMTQHVTDTGHTYWVAVRNHCAALTHRATRTLSAHWWGPALGAFGITGALTYENLARLTSSHEYGAAGLSILIVIIGLTLILNGLLELLADWTRPEGSALLYPPASTAPPMVVATILHAAPLVLIGPLVFVTFIFLWMLTSEPPTVFTHTHAIELLGISLSCLSAGLFVRTYHEYPVSRLWRPIWLISILTTVIHHCTHAEGTISHPAGPLLQTLDALGSGLWIPWLQLAMWGGLNGRSKDSPEQQEQQPS